FPSRRSSDLIYTLSLHDALPICERPAVAFLGNPRATPELSAPEFRALHVRVAPHGVAISHSSLSTSNALGNARSQQAPLPVPLVDRKSTRLNSSHDQISYAVFCL